jgi:hypothetical protein
MALAFQELERQKKNKSKSVHRSFIHLKWGDTKVKPEQQQRNRSSLNRGIKTITMDMGSSEFY